jgi:hypothetical protein
MNPELMLFYLDLSAILLLAAMKHLVRLPRLQLEQNKSITLQQRL